MMMTCASLAAFGGGETRGAGGGPVFDEPTPPGISASDVSNARSFILSVNDRRDTSGLSILPRGTATYSGEAVSRAISNVHILNSNTPVGRLSDQLKINETLDDETKQMKSRLSGQLTGGMRDGEQGDPNVSGTLNCRNQDTRIVTSISNSVPFLPPISITSDDEATGIAGSFNGSINGSETGTFSGTWAVSE